MAVLLVFFIILALCKGSDLSASLIPDGCRPAFRRYVYYPI